MSEPTVSVVMAVLRPDRRQFEEAVRSVLRQTMADFELIVVEDPPATRDLLAAFDDPRIRLLSRPAAGRLGGALNAGINAARGELIARLDADDIATPERLAKQVAFMRAHPDAGVYGSRIAVIDDTGQVIGRRRYPLVHAEIAAALQQYNAISHPAVMFRKSVVLAHGGYDETIAAEDYDLWCRLAVAGVRFANAEEELTLYRFHGGASKFRAVHSDIRTTIAIKRRYFSQRFTVRDRLRLVGEHILLLLPSRIVLMLFRWLVYRAA